MLVIMVLSSITVNWRAEHCFCKFAAAMWIVMSLELAAQQVCISHTVKISIIVLVTQWSVLYSCYIIPALELELLGTADLCNSSHTMGSRYLGYGQLLLQLLK